MQFIPLSSRFSCSGCDNDERWNAIECEEYFNNNDEEDEWICWGIIGWTLQPFVFGQHYVINDVEISIDENVNKFWSLLHTPLR